MKYHNKAYYDKINGNFMYSTQNEEEYVCLIIDNEDYSVPFKLKTETFKEEVDANNIIEGDFRTLELLYGKTSNNFRKLLHFKKQ